MCLGKHIKLIKGVLYYEPPVFATLRRDRRNTPIFVALQSSPPADTPRQDALAGERHETILRIVMLKLEYRSNTRFQSCFFQHRNVELQLNYLISVELVRLLANINKPFHFGSCCCFEQFWGYARLRNK